jgi:hypothetical protein
MVQLIEALHYKSEGRGFESRRCYWNFSLTYSFRPYYGLGVDWASNRNKHQRYLLGGKGGRCLRLTTLPPSHAVCLEILGSLRACSSLSRDSSTFSFSCYIIIYWTIVVLFPMLRYGGIRVMEIECEAKIHCLSLCRLRSVLLLCLLLVVDFL